MKREIKFRGIRADNKEWIYGNIHIPNRLFSNTLICPDTTYGDIAPGMKDGDDYNEIKKCGAAIGHYHRIVDGTEGQFTGLKDKNGVEIYEGDVVNYMIVTYCGDQGAGLGMNCGWYLQRGDFDKWIELESRINENEDNYEVIGNIYQNPELL